MKPVRLILALGLAAAITSAAAQKTTIVYNSIPSPLPGNVASEGPESYAFVSLGDGMKLAATGSGTVGKVTVVLSSWACQDGTWFQGTCSSASGATSASPSRSTCIPSPPLFPASTVKPFPPHWHLSERSPSRSQFRTGHPSTRAAETILPMAIHTQRSGSTAVTVPATTASQSPLPSTLPTRILACPKIAN